MYPVRNQQLIRDFVSIRARTSTAWLGRTKTGATCPFWTIEMMLSNLLKAAPHDLTVDNRHSDATIPVPLWSWAAGKDKKPGLQASEPLSHYPAPSSYFSLKLILRGISQIEKIFKANNLQFISNAKYPANPDRPTGYQTVLPSGAACKNKTIIIMSKH